MNRECILLAALLAACMSPIEAEELRYDEDESLRRDGRILAIPDGVREPERQPEVARRVVAEPEPETQAATRSIRTPRFRMSGDGTVDDCIAVKGEGFPGIDRTNQLVALSQERWLQDTPLAGSATLRIVSLGESGVADEMTTILPAGMDTMAERVCRPLRKQVRGDVRRANEDLAARGFRPMEALPIQYGVEDAWDVYLDLPARERPLQVIAQDGWVITRIPGVKVYERHAIEGNPSDWLYAVHGDRDTGTVVFTFASCSDDSCTCDPLFIAQVERWSDETFAALDAHPCADPQSCRGADYGF